MVGGCDAQLQQRKWRVRTVMVVNKALRRNGYAATAHEVQGYDTAVRIDDALAYIPCRRSDHRLGNDRERLERSTDVHVGGWIRWRRVNRDTVVRPVHREG